MKVLIVGVNYFHYAMSLVKAGELLGHTVQSFWLSDFRNSESEYWKIKVSKYGFKYFEKKYLNQLNDKFIQKILLFKPDICIILNGKDIDAYVLDTLKRQSVKIALFMSDSIQYNCYYNTLMNIKKYDRVFSYEPTDVEFVKNNYGYEDISYLPVGYDETIFFPCSDSKKAYDLCFVGELNTKRLEILNEVARYAKFNHKKFIIYTKPLFPQKYFWYGMRNYFRERKLDKKYPYIKEYIIDHPIYNEEIADLYRKSKICINIHSDGLHTGVNPRTFEILGCGSLEIIDRNHLSQVKLKAGEHIIEFYDQAD